MKSGTVFDNTGWLDIVKEISGKPDVKLTLVCSALNMEERVFKSSKLPTVEQELMEYAQLWWDQRQCSS